MPTQKIPNSLRWWFFIHFLADMLFGIPLLFAPQWTMGLFGFESELDLTARLVGAALIGIGGVSLLAKQKGLESYQSLLSLKVLWASSALVAIALSINAGAPQSAWLFFAIFAAFWCVWVYYSWQLKKD